MKTTVNGVELNYEVSGNPEKPWLTFFRSLATNLHMWTTRRPRWPTTFTFCVTTRATVSPSRSPGACSFDDLIADVVGLWDHLGIEKTHFVGLIGGMTAQGIMLKHADRLMSVVIAN